MKSIFDDPRIGDFIIADGEYSPVTAIRQHGPGEHSQSPIYDHMVAIEYVTPRGSRWKGIGA